MEKIELNNEKLKNETFLHLFEEKLNAVDNKIQFADDELSKVNFEIDKFYIEEDIYCTKQDISLSKVKSDELIDRKIHRYEIILGLLQKKYEIIKIRILNNFYKDELELIEAKITTFKLQIEIISKNDFLKSHAGLNERKNIYNKNTL